MVLEAAGEIGAVPRIIIGDFNTPPECSRRIQQALDTRQWTDTIAWHADAQGRVPGNTYDGKDTDEPNRLDWILLSEETTGASLRAGSLRDTGIPGHRPVFVDLEIAALQEEYWPRRIPTPLPLQPRQGWTDDDELRLEADIRRETRDAWEQAHNEEDGPQAYSMYVRRLEQYYLRRAGYTYATWQRGFTGRDTMQPPRRTRRAAPEAAGGEGASFAWEAKAGRV